MGSCCPKCARTVGLISLPLRSLLDPNVFHNQLTKKSSPVMFSQSPQRAKTRLPRLFVTSQFTRGTSQLFPTPALSRRRTLTSSAPSAMLKTHEDAVEMCKVIERDPGEFLQSYVADDVHWTVSGPFKKTHPLAGVYHSREEFKQNTFVPLSGRFDGGLKLRVVDVISQFPSRPGDPVRVCMELEGVATLKKSQNEWRNYYSWVMHFKEEKAVTVRAYLDSAIVNEAMAD